MRLSYQIPLITSTLIMTTIVVNIFAFQFFMGQLFLRYTGEVAQIEQKNTFSPEKLNALLAVKAQTGQVQSDYQDLLSEIGTISTTLKDISTNPLPYAGSGLYLLGEEHQTNSALASTNTDNTSGKKSNFSRITSLFTQSIDFSPDTPEGRLIVSLLYRLLATNLILIVIFTTIYSLWMRQVFVPIHIIIERVTSALNRSHFVHIPYTREDEFTPLVSTINGLYQSLGLQERIRSNFLSDVSHEIRTPITAVKCYLEAIEDGIMSLDEKTVPLLQTELSRLTRITEKIMQYENLTHDSKQDIHVEAFDIRDPTEIIIHEYQPQLLKNHQKIIINRGGKYMISMDQHMYLQILHNVFSNFIKYAGTGATLTCSARQTKAHSILIFSDTGSGIPESEIHLVREKFYRIDKGRTQDNSMSMGIGLSVVDHIVGIHDGKLDISNNIPHGLRIEIMLPS